ncbi:C39 family peptidase [Spiroplasma endosymbiont of Ammophila pubescens]|uniref:C39 family peptidase n=1 Tax=Spiroplasma endosymbiont of Ammophila pubescens TaxID=3066315 RepID=UPI0032B13478
MVINYVANKKISQEKLANYLQTVKTGTYSGNIPTILNKFTNQNNHKYTRKILGLNYGLTKKEQKIFYNDVNNSLKHNFSVILSMHGKYPWNNHMIKHLIVIHGIQVSEKFEEYTYLIADPWSGEVEVKQSQISSLFTYDANSSIIKSN